VEKIVSLTLRPYQQELVDGVLTAIGRGDKNILVISPTGSGKTISFIGLAERLNESMADDECILIMSHLSLLTTQTRAKFEKFSAMPTGVLQGKLQPSASDKVIVSTIQSARVFDKIWQYYEQTQKKIKYIYIDESHRSLNKSYDDTLACFPDVQVINFTASPYRGKRLAINSYDSVAFQISLQEMIDQKYLVPAVVKQVALDQDTTATRCAVIMRSYLEYEKGKKAIIFMKNKDECRLISDALTQEGVNSAIVTDDVTGRKRDKIFADYDSDGVDVLVSVMALEAGFDSLKCEVVLMVGTHSPSTYIQRIGRALRPLDGLSVKPEHSKQSARIYIFGPTPEIESGEYIKHHNAAMKPKKYDECTSIDERLDWLEMADETDSDEYKFNISAQKVQRLASKINMQVLSRLIEDSAIPPQFMLKLASGVDSFKPIQGGNAPASYQQVLAMQKLGLVPPNGITSNEARLVIQSLTGKATHHHQSDKFIVKEGKFKGSHVKDLAWAYKSIILRKFPYSPLAKMIREFHPKVK
jgi:superfamily II DNA or RNA helicase